MVDALCTDEASFGPSSVCRSMDFTLGFTFRILSILPFSLFLFLAATRTLHLIRRPRLTREAIDVLSGLKLGVTALLFASLAGTLAKTPRYGWGAWATKAYSVELAVTVSLALLSYTHHTRCLAPSTLLFLFLFLAELFSAVQLRTYIITPLHTSALFPPFVVAFAARGVLLLLEVVEKRRFLREDATPKALEPTSSLLSRLLFRFLLPLLVAGRSTAFDLDALNSFGIPPSMTSAAAGGALARSISQSHPSAIFRPSLRAFFPAFAAPAPPKLGLIAATFAQPYLVQTMLAFIGSYTSSNAEPAPAAHGWALVGAYAMVYLVISSCTALYWDKIYDVSVQYRAALVNVIFEKTLRLSASVAQKEGSGAAVTYMSVDVERVVEGIAFFHEAWTAVISIVVAAVILWYQASYAMFPPLAVIVAFLLLTSVIGKTVGTAQAAWMGGTDKRIQLLTSILSQIIPIKLSALEPVVSPHVRPLREREVSALRTFYARIIIVAVFSTATVNFAGLSALGTYVGLEVGSLDPQNLFTILTVVNLVTLPISTVGHCFPQLLASWASLRRIAAFLAREERIDEDISSHHYDTSDDEKVDSCQSSEKTSALVSPPAVEVVRPIVLEGASFAAEAGGQTLLSDVTATFELGKLTMLVGPVGAGKSVLLTSLLSEMHLVSGVATLPPPSTRIAYAPQDAFLWPTTVRENIVLDRPFEPAWYARVLEACCLGPDIARMANGDMTRMGEKGGSVSGGQKQRISLARAVYARCEYTLLDDSFSALDSHTASAVFNALFGPSGLLRGKTIILATHILHHLPTADSIAVVDKGRLVAQGTLPELRSGAVDVACFVALDQDAAPPKPVVDGGIAAAVGIEPAEVPQGVREIGNDGDVQKVEEKKENEKEGDEEQNGVLGSAGWAPYKFYFTSCGWSRLSASLLCLVAYTTMEVGLQIFLKLWSESDTNSHGPWLGGYAAFAVACLLASAVAFFAYTLFTTPHASLEIHRRFINAILAAPVSFFQRTPPGRLVNRCSADTNVIDFAFPLALLDFTFTAVYVLGAMILIFIAVPWLAISAPFIGYAYWCLQKFYLATSRQLQRLEMSSKTPIYSTFGTALSGLVTIRAFRAERLFQDASKRHLDRSQAPMYYRYAGIRFLRTALNLMTLLIAVALAALAVGLRHSTSAGYLGVALSQLVSLATSLTNMLMAWTRVENGVVAVERVHEVVNVEPEEQDSHGKRRAEEPWPSKGTVVFRDVSLKYREELEPVLRNASFSLKGGEKLGICGRTGSGKSSTVLGLLEGISAPLRTGQILIDGVETSFVPLAQLRSSISVVSQDPSLLHLPIRDNLTLGCSPTPSDAEVWDALERVGMRDAVAALEGKLDEMVSSDGLEFSRGQRQLLCIARVLLQRRKIVVLDEASSSMDAQTDARLLAVLRNDLRDVTVIAVAHRIASIMDYDSVLVLDEGQVVEEGAPSVLLEDKDSKFAAFARQQGLA